MGDAILHLAAVILGLFLLLKCPLPKWYRLFGLPFRTLHTLIRWMIRRKGVVWTVLVWWSFVALTTCLVVLGGEHTWVFKLKAVAMLCFPPMMCWCLRGYLHKRRYQLPRR